MSKVKKRGSGILVVVILGIVLTIYVSSMMSKTENYILLNDKYQKNILKYYEKDQNLEDIYQQLEKLNN